MKYFSCVVACGTCGKELTRAANVPESQLFRAAEAVSGKAFCEGHSRNANLDFVWRETEAPTEPAPASVVPEPEDKQPRTPEGILLSDLAALEAGDEPRDVSNGIVEPGE